MSINPQGKVELWYHDGNLFRGHSIVVSLAPDRKFKDAYIAGSASV